MYFSSCIFFQGVKVPYTQGTPGISIKSAHGAGHGWVDRLLHNARF